jgi:hypothetical protein
MANRTATSGVAAMAKLAKPRKGEAALDMMDLIGFAWRARAGVLMRKV